MKEETVEKWGMIGYPEGQQKRSGGADESQRDVEGAYGTPASSRSNPTAINDISKIEPSNGDRGGKK